ncbi:MAG: SRPBCC family protein [Solirubrobacterales bacterium]
MRPISATITIDAPREQVFDLLCDLSRRPAFTDHFQAEYRLERLDPVGVGASARYRLADSGAWLDTAIVEAERPHLIRERGSGGRSNRIPVFCAWELAEGPSPTVAEVTVTFWTEPVTLVDKLHEPFGRVGRLRRGWSRALRRLRDLVESGAPVEPVGVAGGDRIPGVAA